MKLITNNKIIPQELVDQMINEKKIRTSITKQSFPYFFHFYYSHYVKYPTADFQKEIMYLLEKDICEDLFIVAFRGSGKSTIITTAYPIWAILGKQQKKFVLIICQTQSQVKQHMMNLKRELESNVVLKNDLGPFKEESDEWGSSSLVFSNSNARITAASSEQSIRGLRHNQHRPDLIICDDIEDLASTRTKEGRNKIYQWLTSEVIPAGDKNTRLIIVGNLLHEDSLLMRIKENIEKNLINGIFKEYPLIKNGAILWPGKYPTMEDIEVEKKKIGNEIAWQREYLLKIISDEDQIIQPEWISKYDILPDKELRMIVISVDLAISEKETADYTAIIISGLYGYGDKAEIYIHSNPINKRLSFPETVRILKDLYFSLRGGDHETTIFIEDVAYQRSIIQELRRQGINVEGVLIGGKDKRARLNLSSPFIHGKRIHFPLRGAEKIIEQIVGFGVEKNDDLADAFTLGVLKIQEIISRPEPGIFWI